MPSLEALGEFKSSFDMLGDEPRTRSELDLPMDELALPNHEPAVAPGINPEETSEMAMDAEADPGENSADSNLFSFGDLGDLLGSSPSDDTPAGVPSPEDMEFGSFIDSIPDDFSPAGEPMDSSTDESTEGPTEEIAEISADEPVDELLDESVEGAGAGVPAQDDDDFSYPPDLLNGFADEIESEQASSGDEDFGNFDLSDSDSGNSDFGDLGLGDAESGDSDFGDLGLGDAESGDSDFGDLGLGDLDIESSGLGANEQPVQEDAPSGDLDFLEDFPDIDGLDSGDDFGVVQDADLGNSVELLNEESLGNAVAKPPSAEDETVPDDFGSMGLDDFPDFSADGNIDLPEEDFSPGTAEDDAGLSADIEDFSGGESLFNEEGSPSIDEEDLISDFSEPEEISLAEENGIEASDSSEEIGLHDEDDEDSFDVGGLSDFDNGAVLEEISGDSFDNFQLDSGTLAGNFDLGGEEGSEFGDGLGDLEEFSLSGIDSVFDGASPAQKTGAKGAARIGGRSRAFSGNVDEVEEISLNDEELEQLQNTLSSYPLNLRIACGELIAEQVVAPDLMSRLVKLLINGAPAKDTAALAGQILGRTIAIPKGFEKKSGEELEAEQSSFAYIFVHNFLPVLRLFMMIALFVLSVGYLGWKFIYTPLRAERIYKLGYERIGAGEYTRANDRFLEAFKILPKIPWFYKYARAFREAKQYTLAEEKYRELLYFTASRNKRRIPEKAAVLEYADMETNDIGNYQAADEILRHNILDFFPFDRDALLALGDNSLAWGDYERERLEDAREYYAQYMEKYGRSDPLLERMLKYFIRTDVLEEVLSLQSYFMASEKRSITSPTLAELGGYLLDKRYEKVSGVPDEYLDSIGGIRSVLLRAIRQDSMLPESYYHLARYYRYFDNLSDEKLTLDLAVKVFDAAKEESPKRIRYHINTLCRHGEVLIELKEFFPAEESLFKGLNLYQDGLSRRLLVPSPEFGKIYANLGDLEYFVKDGDMRSAIDYYSQSEQNGWAPPEMQYRMGAAYYQLRQWGPAQDYLTAAYREQTPNRRILYALGNVSYMRGNYFAAQGYYDRLLEMLDAERERFPLIMPSDDEEQMDLAERLMVAQNNLGVALEALTERTGNSSYRFRAQGLYSDSERAWDVLTRNPRSMIRMRPSPEITAPGVNPAFLNIQNSLRPVSGFEPQFFLRIDKDMLEPSLWEDLAPPGYRISEGIYTGR